LPFTAGNDAVYGGNPLPLKNFFVDALLAGQGSPFSVCTPSGDGDGAWPAPADGDADCAS
jgi:hypothetical protein